MPLAPLAPFLALLLAAPPQADASLSWQDLAPTFHSRELGPAVFGGRIVDLALDKNNASELWVASASGGLWHSTNRGTTWTGLFQDTPTTSIGCLTLDPNLPGRLWIGTGEANNQRSSYWGSGVYRSDDRGKSWQAMGLPDSHHVGRIAIDPRDSNRVLVAALGHLYTANEERGVFLSVDGGQSWQRTLFVDADTGAVDLALDPNNPDRIFAATYQRRRRAWNFDGAGPGSAIWRSEDGGLNWKRLAGGLPEGEIGRIGLAIHPGTQGSDSIVYATVSNQNEVLQDPLPATGLATRFENGELVVQKVEVGSGAQTAGLKKGDVLLRWGELKLDDPFAVLRTLGKELRHQEHELLFRRGDEELRLVQSWDALIQVDPAKRPRKQIGGEIYRSTDGGQSWEKRNQQPVGGSPPYYYGQIRVDPQDPDRLYLCSVPMMTSADGGKTWQRIAGSVHVDHHALAIDPVDSNHLLLGNDGGLAISYDQGTTWDHFSNLPIAQFYAVAVDMSRPYRVYGGTQDNGTWGGPSRGGFGGIGNELWQRVGGGDGFYAQVDPRDPDTVYGESQFGAIYRRDLATGATKSIRPPRASEGTPPQRFNWSSPILISHHNSEIVYFGGNRLFKSYDRGDHWQVVSEDLTTRNPDRIAGNVPHCTITTIAESPLDPNLLLIGTDDGKVQRSRDGGLSWQDLSDHFPGAPQGWWISRVEWSHHDPHRALVSFTGYREDDFRPFAYRTEDQGESWIQISDGLPQGSVNVVREDPRTPGLLWCGTEFGAWYSPDLGRQWVPIPGLPRVAVHDLVVHPRDQELVLATHGRGLWVAEIAAVQEAAALPKSRPTQLFQPADLLTKVQGFPSGSGDRHFRGQNPSPGHTLAWHLAESLAAEPKAILEVINPSNTTIHRVELDADQRSAGIHHLRWNPNARSGGGRRSRRPQPLDPGTYTVRLSIGEQVTEQHFEVVRADS